MIKLTKDQQNQLKQYGRTDKMDPVYGTPNPDLDACIEKLQRQNPDAFLKPQDLIHRVFMVKPKNVFSYSGYVYGDIKEVPAE